MITRAQMPRQLRNKGGITSVVPRKEYGIGSKFQEYKDKALGRVRKLIPNELANVAVKAAPFVAPFYPGAAALMRGIGRFDQRGSLSDAFKQGIGTYVFGKAAGKLGGAESTGEGFFGGQKFTKAGFDEGPVGRLFQGKTPGVDSNVPKTPSTEGTGFMKRATEATIDKIPFTDKLPQGVKEKLLVGGITSGASALYSYFTGEFEPQEPGETVEEYMARRRERVKSQMRQVMDSYYTPLRNPEYAAMSGEEKDNFIDGIVGQGLAAGGMPTGIMRTNKAGVMERDYRDKGGFVPVGIKEKADDVPAMLSKNEFVFTADAVRGAGNGSIEKGAQKMYDTMKKLEKRVV